jgi:FMN phosphatase YigB (HAD superfamily)
MEYEKHAFIDIDGTVVDLENPYMSDPEIGSDFFRGILREIIMKKFTANGKDALCIIRENELGFNGCMFKTAQKLDVDIKEYWNKTLEWQMRYMKPFEDAVEMIKKLCQAKINLHVVSNNSRYGILAKLCRAGLADITGSPYFKTIFGMDLLGMGSNKSQKETFSKIIAMGDFKPENIVTIGDDAVEDWKIPASAGIRKSIIVNRKQPEAVIEMNEGAHFVNSLIFAPEICGGF